MILRLIDKLVFGLLLILALQVPQLSQHYHQFISGQLDALSWQVKGYELTANKYEYKSVEDMIAHHLHNNVASVRDDAKQKLDTLAQYHELTTANQIFTHSNLLSKAIYMFNPSRYMTLKKAMQNYKLGIPITFDAISFAVMVALLFNFLLFLPIYRLTKKN